MKTDWTFNWLTLNVNFSENYYSSSSAFTLTINFIILLQHHTTSPSNYYTSNYFTNFTLSRHRAIFGPGISTTETWCQLDDAWCSVMQRDAERCRQHSKENLAIIQWCWAQVAPSALWRTTTLLIIMSGDPDKKKNPIERDRKPIK